MAYSFQKIEFSFNYIPFLAGPIFFALNDVICGRTLRHINDDVR